MNSRVFQVSIFSIMLLVVGIWLMVSKNFFVGLIVLAFDLALLTLILSLSTSHYQLSFFMALFTGLCWLVLALVFGLQGESTAVLVLVAYGLWYIVYSMFALTSTQQIVNILKIVNHPGVFSLLIFSHVCVAISSLLLTSFPPGHISPWVIVSPALASIVLSVLFCFGCASILDLRTSQHDPPGSIK